MLVKAYERILEVGKVSHCLLDIMLVRGLEYDLSMICEKTRPLFRRDNLTFPLLLWSNML